LVNITGGTDLTLFEVDEAVNKIRAEVDPEAELIFGAIEDENLTGKIRVSIVATSLDGEEPEKKPVISMVHRLHNRNTGYSDNFINTSASNQATLNATEGATALNINTDVDQNKVVEQNSEQDEANKLPIQNISMESADYLQNVEDIFNDENLKSNENMETFEVDSIELATPELFNNNNVEESENSFNQDTNNNEGQLEVFENSKSEKEAEMFEESNLEGDFEIPAFLRRQKN